MSTGAAGGRHPADLVVVLKGGLGNQLFQWAFGEELAAGGARVRYDTGLLGSDVRFELGPLIPARRLVRAPGVVRRARRRLGLPASVSPWREIREPGFAHRDPAELDLRGRCLLEGYWQSPKYFTGTAEDLRSAVLDWADGTLTPEGSALRDRIRAGRSSWSVHVRRGDYLAPGTREYHGVLGADYYRRAIRTARDSGARELYVFTNDPDWVAANLAAPDLEIVPWSVATSPVGEIGLMAACAGHVVANSSFSWWGAWLGGPEDPTVAPERWFATDLDTADLVPSGWVRLPNG